VNKIDKRKRLALDREVVRSLSVDQLDRVAGALRRETVMTCYRCVSDENGVCL
jgi:hypothetical protein